MAWDMESPAERIATMLWQVGEQILPAEILKLDNQTAGIVVDVDGIDYILTLARVPRQRPRPTFN